MPPKGDGNLRYIAIAIIVVIIFMIAIFYPLLRKDSILAPFISNLSGANYLNASGANQTINPPNPRTINITGINLYTSEFDNVTDSFYNSTKPYGAIAEFPNVSFPYTLTFVNNGAAPYTINSIRSGTPGFNITGTTPNLPYLVTPGSSFLATLTIRTPPNPYIGVLQLLVSGTTTSKGSINYGTARITVVNEHISIFDNTTGTYSNYTRVYSGLNVSAGSQFPYPLTFTDNGTSNLIINYIKTGTNGFSIANESPGLPYTLTQGSSIGITILHKQPEGKLHRCPDSLGL